MPGASLCLGCGQPMAVAVHRPETLVPRVRPQNPLDVPPARSRREGRPLLGAARERLDAWASLRPALGRLLRGALGGVVPGRAAVRRGDQRTGLLQIALVIGPLALLAPLWRTAWVDPLARLALAAWCWAPIDGGRRALGRGEVPSALGLATVASAGSVLALVLGALSVASFAFNRALPTVHLNQPRFGLEPGELWLRPVDGPPPVGAMVAAEDARGLLTVAPVLAGPGQRVTVHGGRFLVDGAYTTISAPLPRGETHDRQAPIDVPEGAVLLFDVPLRPVPAAAILGEVVYRWTPPADRGPMRWESPPPPEPDAP